MSVYQWRLVLGRRRGDLVRFGGRDGDVPCASSACVGHGACPFLLFVSIILKGVSLSMEGGKSVRPGR